MKVDPTQLAELAGRLDEAGERAQGAVPTAADNSDLQPAEDPFSQAGAARLTKWATELANFINEAYLKARLAAYAIGDAGEGYADADISGAIDIDRGSAEGTRVPNRVSFPPPLSLRTAPAVSTDLPSDVEGDDEAFAVVIEAGDVGALGPFIEAWGHIYAQVHQEFRQMVVDTGAGVREWQDVGVETVAPLLAQFLAWLDKAAEAVSTIVARAANLQTAFIKVVKDHPSSQDIRNAKNAVRAQTSPAARAAEAAKLRAVLEKAKVARQQYSTAIDVPDKGFDLDRAPDIASPTLAAVGNEISPPPARVASGPATNGAEPATNGANGATATNTTVAEKSDSSPTGAENGEGTNNGENSSEALSSLENALGNTGAENPSVGQAENPAGNAGNQAVDPNAAQLANSLRPQNQGQNAGAPFDSAFEDSLGDRLGDYGTSGPGSGYGPGGYGGGGGGGAFGGGGVRPPDTRTAALSGTANSVAAPKLASPQQFASVASSGGSDRGGLGGRGMGMPFMPMGGMGGAGMGNQNNGNPNKFEEDRPVVAEDKLPKGLEHHTVNEKPPVVPDATKETLLAAGRKSDTNQGGTPA